MLKISEKIGTIEDPKFNKFKFEFKLSEFMGDKKNFTFESVINSSKEDSVTSIFYYITDENNILYIDRRYLKKEDSNKETILKDMKDNYLKSDYSNDLNKLKNLKIVLFVIENIDDNKKLLFELERSFILIQNKIKEDKNYIYGFTTKNIIYIIGILTSISLLSVIYKMTNWGIPINTISTDSLLILLQIILGKISLFFILLAFIMFIIASLLLLIFMRIVLFMKKKKTKISNLNLLLEYFLDFKIMLLITFFLTIVVIILTITFPIKNNLISNIIKYFQTPSVEKVTFIDNKLTQNILLIGNDSALIYYFDDKSIQNIIDEKKLNNFLCENNASYLSKLTYLLENANLSNKRFNRTNIKNIKFLEEKVPFEEAFCKKEKN